MRIAIDRKAPTRPAAEREDQVERADVLVVRRVEPAPPEGRRVVVMSSRVGGVSSCVCHGETSMVLPCFFSDYSARRLRRARRRRRRSRRISSSPPRARRRSRCLADDADGDRHVGMAVAAQFRALAVVDALALGLEPGLVEAAGTASILKPKDGTAKEWITSAAVTCTRTTLFDRHDHLVVDAQQARLAGLQVLRLDHVGVELEAAALVGGIFVAPVPGVAGRLDDDVVRRDARAARAGAGRRGSRWRPGSAPARWSRRPRAGVVRRARGDRVLVLVEAA